MDALNVLEAMKADLAMMQGENICMVERLMAAEIELEETKRMLAEYKDMKKLADDMVDFVIGAGGNNVHDSGQINLVDETMKGLLEEAMRDFTEGMNQARSRGSRPADGGNGGGHDGSTDDQNLEGRNINVNEACGNRGGGSKRGKGGGAGGSKCGNGGGRPE